MSIVNKYGYRLREKSHWIGCALNYLFSFISIVHVLLQRKARIDHNTVIASAYIFSRVIVTVYKIVSLFNILLSLILHIHARFQILMLFLAKL